MFTERPGRSEKWTTTQVAVVVTLLMESPQNPTKFSRLFAFFFDSGLTRIYSCKFHFKFSESAPVVELIRLHTGKKHQSRLVTRLFWLGGVWNISFSHYMIHYLSLSYTAYLLRFKLPVTPFSRKEETIREAQKTQEKKWNCNKFTSGIRQRGIC